MNTTKRRPRACGYARLRAKHGDQAYFHTPEWQEKEREADEAIARGELHGPFVAEKAIGALHRLAGPRRRK